MTITLHNFAKPARLAGDWKQRLSSWFQAAFMLAGKAWSREIAGALEAHVVDIETVRAADVLAEFGDRSAGYRILVAGNRLPTLLLLPRPLLLTVIDGLLGATVDTLVADRELTAVEQSVAEYFLQTLWLTAFKDSWPCAAQVIWQFPRAEPNPGCSRLFAPDELVAAFRCELRGPFGVQECVWLFQKKGLAEVMGWGDGDPILAEPHGSRIEMLVHQLPLDVVVVLGDVEVCISQLSQLQVGDVILLNQRTNEPLTALVGDEPKFRGWAGRAGFSTAFRIDSLIGG
jgi:flagellar motor switch protein FliM